MTKRELLAAAGALFTGAALAGAALPTKPVLTLASARQLLQAAEAEAHTAGVAVSIAVCDDGGHLLALYRMDNAPPATAAIAVEKARTAALIRRPGKAFEDIINGGRVAMLSIGSLQGMLEGGEPLLLDGQTIGAVGVSGGRPNEDSLVVRGVQRALGAQR